MRFYVIKFCGKSIDLLMGTPFFNLTIFMCLFDINGENKKGKTLISNELKSVKTVWK